VENVKVVAAYVKASSETTAVHLKFRMRMDDAGIAAQLTVFPFA
jgi:hypothetical protein